MALRCMLLLLALSHRHLFSGRHLRFRCLLLLVGLTAVCAQSTFEQAGDIGAQVLPQRPVDRHIGAHGLDQLACDAAQGLVTQRLHRTVVCLQRVVEGQYLPGQARASLPALASRISFASWISSSTACAALMARF